MDSEQILAKVYALKSCCEPAMTGNDEERLFIIIPTDKEILCKWFGVLSLYGLNDDCKFLDQLLTHYSNTPIVYNSNNPSLANAVYIELLNKAVVINSTRGVLSDALQKLADGSTRNSQSHSHSNSPKHTTQPGIISTLSAPDFKQDSDSLIDEPFDPPFQDPAPEIKNEVDDSVSLGSEKISHAEPIVTIRPCSVVLTRLPDTSAAKYKATSTFSRSSPANKDIQKPAIPITTHSVNPGLVIFGDLNNCLQSKPTGVPTENRISVAQPSEVVQSKSKIKSLVVNGIKNVETRGRPRFTPFRRPDRLVLIAPKPTLVPFVKPDYIRKPPRTRRKYVKKIQLESKSEMGQERPLTVIVAKSQVNNTTTELSVIQSSSVVIVPIEQSSLSEIGLEMNVTDSRCTAESDPVVNSQIAIETADVNKHLSGGIPGDENEQSTVLQVKSGDLVQDEEFCGGQVPYDEADDQSEMPELGSDRVFSPVPATADVTEGVDEQSDTADGRDSLVEGWLGRLLTLGGSDEQLMEVVPDEVTTGLTVSKASETYGTTPERRSNRLEDLNCSGKDYHQMEAEPNGKDTTLDLVDLNGEKLDAGEEEKRESTEGINDFISGAPLPVLKYGTLVQEGELQYIRCNFCKCQLELGMDYTNHTEMHLKNVCYCDQCGQGCLNRKKLEAHVWNKHVFRCRYCLDISSFLSLIDRDDHERVEHIAFHHARMSPVIGRTRPRPKEPKTSEKSFKKRGFSKKWSNVKLQSTSAEGYENETPSNSLVCLNVDSSTLDQDLIEANPIYIPIDKNELFKCSECSRTLKNKRCYAYHMACHEEQKSGVECQQCGKVVESRVVLDDHLREHSMLELFCSYCPDRFTSKTNLDHHEAIHLEHHHVANEPNPESVPPVDKQQKGNAGQNLPHVCYICGKQMAKKLIISHVRMHDPLLQGIKVECKICGRNFLSEKRLSAHIKLMHKKVKPFVCDQCGKAFSNKPALRKHIRIHTGELPFQCSFCDKKFRCPNNMDQHENVHRGIRKYECEFCSKRFFQTAALIQHRRRHTGFKVTEEYERVVARRALELGPTEITETDRL